MLFRPLLLAAALGQAAASPKPCFCFSLCSLEDVEHFAQRLPEAVTDEGSPWFPYLQAVYKGHVDLPFPLANLSLVHHAGGSFARRHPHVRVPAAPCTYSQPRVKPLFPKHPHIMTIGRRRLLRRQEGWEQCRDCDGWLEPKPVRPQRPGLNFQVRGSWDGAASDFTFIFAYDWRPVRNYTYVEVTHHAQWPEGSNGYGQWFNPTPGSDIWLNVGRTLVFESKRAAFYGLLKPWATMTGCRARTPADVIACVGPWVGEGIEPLDVFAFMAYHLAAEGVLQADTLQTLQGVLPDITVVSPATVAPPALCPCPGGPGCGPVERARECGPGQTTCTNVPLRTARGTQQCHCVEGERHLNCNGQLRETPPGAALAPMPAAL